MELFKEGEDTCKNIYNDNDFFKAYAGMERSQKGLAGAGEWHQLEPLFPKLADSTVLDLGCGYGWHCKFAAESGAMRVLGIDLSRKMSGTVLFPIWPCIILRTLNRFFKKYVEP